MACRSFAVFLTLALLSGCGLVARSTGPMGVGQDTYRVITRAPMGDATASQKMAFDEATQHCHSLSRKVVAQEVKSQPYEPVQLTYKCLREGDPNLAPNSNLSAPDTAIEIRER